MVDIETGADASMIHELTRMRCKRAKQPLHAVELVDTGDIANVALNHRVYIVVIPILAPGPALAGDGLGITSCQNQLDKVFAKSRRAKPGRLPSEQRVQKTRWRLRKNFGLSKRQQADDFHSPGK